MQCSVLRNKSLLHPTGHVPRGHRAKSGVADLPGNAFESRVATPVPQPPPAWWHEWPQTRLGWKDIFIWLRGATLHCLNSCSHMDGMLSFNYKCDTQVIDQRLDISRCSNSRLRLTTADIDSAVQLRIHFSFRQRWTPADEGAFAAKAWKSNIPISSLYTFIVKSGAKKKKSVQYQRTPPPYHLKTPTPILSCTGSKSKAITTHLTRAAIRWPGSFWCCNPLAFICCV